MKIINISTGDSNKNFKRTINFNDLEMEIEHYGTDYDLEEYQRLIEKYDGEADIIAISGLPKDFTFSRKRYRHPDTEKMISSVRESAVTDGILLSNLYLPWAIRRALHWHPHDLQRKRVGVFGGLLNIDLFPILEEFASKITFCDPYLTMNLPFNLNSIKLFNLFYKFMLPVIFPYKIHKRSVKSFKNSKRVVKRFNRCDVLILIAGQFNLLKLGDLTGKVIISDCLSQEQIAQLEQRGVKSVINAMPELIDLPEISFSLLEAIFQLASKKLDPISYKEVFEWIDQYQLKPTYHKFQESEQKVDKFAFVIHPLQVEDLFIHPALQTLKKSGPILKNAIENLVTYLPGAKYGKITGVVSEATGKEIEGIIYTILHTPKKLMKAKPESIYVKLAKVAGKAQDEDVKLIGLGAYTKIVGDAGISVSRMSPIPVTTGNALSSASTLWAASLAVDKMNFVSKENGIYQGKAMVVGATGSIGKVTAKILAKSWRELVIVAPKPYKLAEVIEEIKIIAPQCHVEVDTNPDQLSQSCDLIVTTTSAHGKKIIDIEKVKSGAVICDVSRPFDITKEDALKRPDVLMIASGEVELPGDVKVGCDIGLRGNVVYACLAETALLVLEGRFECFTIGRTIDFNKVIEIDHLSKKHGVKLAAIMGHDREITDSVIEHCRQQAVQRQR